MNDKNDTAAAEVVVEAGRYVTHYMSDLYGDKDYAVLLKADGTYERVERWDEPWKVNATPEQIATYKAVVAANKARREAEAEALRLANEAEQARKAAEKAEREAACRAKNLKAEAGIEVAKGDVVEVVKGSNKGTVGKVFWMGDGKLGTKLGIALDDEKDGRGWHKNVAWVLKKNVVKAIAKAA